MWIQTFDSDNTYMFTSNILITDKEVYKLSDFILYSLFVDNSYSLLIIYNIARCMIYIPNQLHYSPLKLKMFQFHPAIYLSFVLIDIILIDKYSFNRCWWRSTKWHTFQKSPPRQKYLKSRHTCVWTIFSSTSPPFHHSIWFSSYTMLIVFKLIHAIFTW